MKDPYDILGIGRDATNEEVKQAYKDMMRKYHPDNYADNPLEDLAVEKTKEINEAYDQIMRQRKGSGSFSSQGNSQFADIRRMISAGRIIEAEEVLNGIPDYKRSAEWHFLKGTIFYQRGWLSEAMRFYRTATEMDPGNYEYKNTYEQMVNQQNGQYQNNPYGGYRTGGSSASGCDCCCSLLAADCCCECMGGDLIRCC